MATATRNKMDRLLTEVLREGREVRFLVEPISRAVRGQKGMAKKLPLGLKQALHEMEAGKIIGPFHSVKAFMADLKR